MVNFEGFEGIDLDSKEVYETSDVEDDFEISESVDRRDSIVEPEFDLSNSRSRFEKNMIDAHVTDFSGRIDKLASYETYTVKETTQNKMKRLYLELQELDDEIENNDEPTEDIVKLKELYNKINKKTKDFTITTLDGIDNNASETISNPKKENPSQDFTYFKEIETRISEIERTIGVNFKPDSSIQSTINDLFKKFKLLSNDQEELQSVNRMIDAVNSKLEKTLLSKKSESVKLDIDEDRKIDEIYKNFQVFSNYSEELPLIIKRLESLNDLHLRAANSTKVTEELYHAINTMKTDFDKWDESLSNLEGKFNELNTSFKNIKS